MVLERAVWLLSLFPYLASCCCSCWLPADFLRACPNVPTSWRPRTYTSPNCTQPVTSSASGRLEPHTRNSFQFPPFWISVSVPSPIPPSFSLIPWQEHSSPQLPSYLLPLVPWSTRRWFPPFLKYSSSTQLVCKLLPHVSPSCHHRAL